MRVVPVPAIPFAPTIKPSNDRSPTVRRRAIPGDGNSRFHTHADQCDAVECGVAG